jgi:hypothetical protein
MAKVEHKECSRKFARPWSYTERRSYVQDGLVAVPH